MKKYLEIAFEWKLKLKLFDDMYIMVTVLHSFLGFGWIQVESSSGLFSIAINEALVSFQRVRDSKNFLYILPMMLSNVQMSYIH